MHSPIIRRVLAGVASLAVAAGLGACTASGAASTSPTRVLDVTAHEYGYSIEGGGQVAAGLVSVRLRDIGTEPHQATIARLHDGVSFEQFGAELRTNPEAALASLDFVGGVNTVDPHGVASASMMLSDGNYVIVCFVAGPDGVPHVAKGMMTTFVVSGPKAGHRPETDGTVRLRSYGFTFPREFGHGTYAVTNVGDEPHELDIVRVAPGKTAADVKAYLGSPKPVGPPPFASVGGVAALSPGRTAYVKLDLRRGDYVALCFVPDDKTQVPHFLMGMFEPFHVG